MDPIRFTLFLGLALLAMPGNSYAQDTASDAVIVRGGVMDIDGNSGSFFALLGVVTLVSARRSGSGASQA